MNNIEAIRASILDAMTTGTDEPEGLSKSAEDALASAIQNYLTASTATASEPASKGGKSIKRKGIALTAAAQGGPANLRPVSLLMKSKIEDLTEAQKATLELLGCQMKEGPVA